MTRETFTRSVSRRQPTIWRDDFLAEMCRGRHVLDIGCVDHTHETSQRLGSGWLHERLREVATSIVGTDYLADDIEILNARGYHIVAANAEDFDLGRTFDVIIAGDIIEHLNNVGRFLESTKRHMRPDSDLVITTVNPFDVEQMMQVLLRGRVAVNPDHTMWLDPRVFFHVTERAGLQVTDFRWTRTRFRPVSGHGVTSRLMQKLSDVVSHYRPITRASYAVVLRTT